jgi:hypothetical protein
MAATATLVIERIEAPVLQRAQPVARLGYRYHYAGNAEPHLTGQPCDVVATSNDESAEVDSYLVAFACGCREVVPGWTLSPNSPGI